MKYPVLEQFTSFQGEGVHMGRAAHFVRLFGCNVGCTWCDTPESWKTPGPVKMLDAHAIADRIDAPAGAFVVITGGEPTLHQLDYLIAAIAGKGRDIHIETAGTNYFCWHSPYVSWVTVSPKRERPPLPRLVKVASEFKIVVDEPAAIAEGLAAIAGRNPAAPIYLQPEWSRREDPAILRAIATAVQMWPGVRAGVQLHKHYEVR